MQPRESEPAGTSLELTSTPEVGEPIAPAEGTNLELPPSVSAPASPGARQSDEAAVPAGPGPLGTLVTAHLRRVEIAMLGRVLIATLSDALPASMIRVERRRSLRRLGHAAEPIGITITAGDRTLSFRAPEVGVVEASAGHTVRGVVLSSTPVPIAQWLDQLGEVLDQVTCEDEATRVALERTFLS